MSEQIPPTGELRAPPSTVGPQGHFAPVIGTVAHVIGTGEHAQTAIVYTVVKWCFALGAVLSVIFVAVPLLRGHAVAVADVKDVWSIFGPLITLALGYLFGKGR
jgi:hypothetical protein